MQLTIDIRESALDKIIYLLNSLKPDVKILDAKVSDSLDIQEITPEDEEYAVLQKSREQRDSHLQDYGSLDDIEWD